MSQRLSHHLVVSTSSCLHSLTLPPHPQGPGLNDKENLRVGSCSIRHSLHVTPESHLWVSLCPAECHRMSKGVDGREPGTAFLESRSTSCGKLFILHGCPDPGWAGGAPLIALQSCLPSALSPDTVVMLLKASGLQAPG